MSKPTIKSKHKKKAAKLAKRQKPAARSEMAVSWKNKKDLLIIASILVITFIVFSPSLQNDFTNWDDDLYVTKNELLTNPDKTTISDFFTTDVAGNFHPLTMISLAFDEKIAGNSPTWFHLHNIILHLLNTFLVFLLIWKLSGGNRFISFFSAIIFGIHPMHVESVTWISERKDVLYSFFFLLALIIYFNYQKKPSWFRYLAIFLLFLLSCLSKSAAVVLPIVMILFDFWLKKITWKSLLEKIPFIIVAVLIGLKALETQSATNALGDFAFFSFFEKIRFASYGFFIYIVKFFVPYQLASFHPYPGQVPMFYNVSILLVVALFAAVTLIYKKKKYPLFGLLFYAITIALVLQFITVGNAVIAERYTYIPYIGLGFLVGSFLFGLLRNKSKDYKPLVVGLVSVFLIILSIVTFQRTKVWKDAATLWTDVIKKYPEEDGAYVNRGHWYRSINDYDRALNDYNKAIEINPKNFRAYSNRGKVYFDRNQDELALADYNRSIELNQEFAQSYANRGGLYGKMGNYEKSINDLNRSIELDPNHVESYLNRALTHYITQNYEAAIKDCNVYLLHNPDQAGMFDMRGSCYRMTGKFEKSIRDHSIAIQLDPGEGIYYLNRSAAYQANGDGVNASADIKRARELGD